MMQSAYARNGNGPMCHTLWVGLGIAAMFTGAHATVAARSAVGLVSSGARF
ncbi:hypothetical protein Val02_89190 [Virgisporangium aliadipatigenens]|uniref:Uncharacterized protein n=1 Tax=Virgisporangium aliadipatigenens TaxID=741659 RepID=A0A8J4DWA0_9ACTN|nr:hypothetical protein Val02_89190 [Virgisporangium aliadipatigenens]